jgi:acyl carrier protein
MPFSDDEVTQRLIRVFGWQPELNVQPETTAADVKDSGSLSHINLVAVEKEFKVRFTTNEIMSLKNIGYLDALVRQRGRN